MSRLDQQAAQDLRRADPRDEALAAEYTGEHRSEHMPPGSAARAKAGASSTKTTASKHGGPVLPEHPDEILGLPAGLGDLQAWITGLMTYPSLPMAGFTAWAVGAYFAMASVRIDSRRGLGVNEQFMALAPTGYRSEERRVGNRCVSTG